MVIPVLMAKYTKKKVKEKKATDYFDLVNIELAKPEWDPFEDYNEMIMQVIFYLKYNSYIFVSSDSLFFSVHHGHYRH